MNRTVLITGCSSGIGRATAETFLDEEWQVVATARDPSDIEGLREAGCETAALDVTDDEQIREAVRQTIDETGRLDCLVNNAGFGLIGAIEDVPVERVHDQFDVNVYGPHRLTRAVLPHMREQGDGTIVNVSSVSGRLSVPAMGVYSGSKFALEAMSDALRPEVADHGIDVALVEPGPVDTGFEERAAAESDTLEHSGTYDWAYRAHEDTQDIGLGGTFGNSPREVAEVIVEAACSPNPDPRYPVGHGRWMVKLRSLPDRWRDRIYGAIRRFV
jgi:NAD(P)-dependent dehydrogenase (short-subunit alcohol dehydrogenase family)